MNTKGDCEHDVKNMIKATLQKWKDLIGVLCDAKMTKEKVYKTTIRSVLEERRFFQGLPFLCLTV